MNTPLLVVDSVQVRYGVVEALRDVSLTLGEREIVAVLGANGAGKTTLLRAISGLIPLVRGRILFCGKDIRSLLPFELVRHGLVHVPEGRRVFSTLTVEENLVLGLYGVRHSLSDAEVQKRKEWIFRLFPVLRERRRQLAGTLSGGEQQMLALGRGLISRPKVLLLDEPSLGLAPRMVQDIFQLIQGIHQEEGVSILLVEQNVRRALSVASYAYVLESGRVVLSGKPSDLLRDERLHAAYLGGSGMKRRMS